MKKLIILLFTITSVMVLVGCESTPDTDLEDRVTVLETQVDELEEILINLEVIEGLNGQREYYIPNSNDDEESLYQGVSAVEYETLGTELDKANSPSYVLDINEEYIPFIDVANLLVDKYYGANVTVNSATIGATTEIILDSVPFTQEEYIARTVLLVEELSNYDFYIISSSQLVIQTQFGSTARITIPIATLRSSFITMNADIIINGTYEIRKTGLNYDSVLVKDLYNQYVASETYINYVLDFK